MSRIKSVIIGLLLVATGPFLTGCGALRLTYSNGSYLSWLWMDGYLDFSRAQSPDIQRRLDTWFEWHRATQLPTYMPLLAQAAAEITGPATPAVACRWADRIREQLEPAIQRGLADFAEVTPGLGDPQLRHLEKRYAKNLDELRSDYLQEDASERLREAVKRTRERAEQLYGSLDDAQLKVIRNGVAASPFKPEMWLAERQRRYKDVVQTLRKFQADKPELPARVAALKALVQRIDRSPDADYEAYQAKLSEYNCAFAAQIHNATTPAQRLKAREKLKGWEEDLRSLTAPAPGG
jgi:hypothetical protein